MTNPLLPDSQFPTLSLSFSQQEGNSVIKLLDQLEHLQSTQKQLEQELERWAGRSGALQLAEYFSTGPPAGLTMWHTQLGRLNQELAKQNPETLSQFSETVSNLAQQLQREREQADQELSGLRQLLPSANRVMQARTQAASIREKLQAQRGLGKIWTTLSGKQSALQQELNWVERQVQRSEQDYEQVRRTTNAPHTLEPSDISAHYQGRTGYWGDRIRHLSAQQVAAQQARDQAQKLFEITTTELNDSQQAHLATWPALAARYHLPDTLQAWEDLLKRRAEGEGLWQRWRESSRRLSTIQQSLEHHWQTWPAEYRTVQAARSYLNQQAITPAPPTPSLLPNLPWPGPTPTGLHQPSVVPFPLQPPEPSLPLAPLLPWADMKQEPQPVVARDTCLMPAEEPAVPQVTEALTVLPEPPIPLPQTSGTTSAAAFPLPEMTSPLRADLPSFARPPESAAQPPQVNPWLGTLPGQLNPVGTQPTVQTTELRQFVTPAERTRQIAVKVAADLGRHHQINLIEDLLAGTNPALKVQRVTRQLQTMAQEDIWLAEELYAWWPAQEHFGADYRMRNGEWHRAASSISRRTCEQFVSRFSSTPCFEEVILLLEALHEQIGCAHVAFAYQLQTILDEMPADVDIETWINWLRSDILPEDGEDWDDEIDLQRLARRRFQA
ncbi:hypothetical protein [Deinococcus fonticola]|uniref:hypothetical protein n=1 Tax=Deinococcus fonticola TaxID=2528713 RepID=UPI001074E0DB|nr:hypothetical protein [Deinococcus fonticola]